MGVILGSSKTDSIFKLLEQWETDIYLNYVLSILYMQLFIVLVF